MIHWITHWLALSLFCTECGSSWPKQSSRTGISLQSGGLCFCNRFTLIILSSEVENVSSDISKSLLSFVFLFHLLHRSWALCKNSALERHLSASRSVSKQRSDKWARARPWASFQRFLSVWVNSSCLCGSFSSCSLWLVSLLALVYNNNNIVLVRSVKLTNEAFVLFLEDISNSIPIHDSIFWSCM